MGGEGRRRAAAPQQLKYRKKSRTKPKFQTFPEGLKLNYTRVAVNTSQKPWLTGCGFGFCWHLRGERVVRYPDHCWPGSEPAFLTSLSHLGSAGMNIRLADLEGWVEEKDTAQNKL